MVQLTGAGQLLEMHRHSAGRMNDINQYHVLSFSLERSIIGNVQLLPSLTSILLPPGNYGLLSQHYFGNNRVKTKRNPQPSGPPSVLLTQ
jgi:hypothetical protein